MTRLFNLNDLVVIDDRNEKARVIDYSQQRGQWLYKLEGWLTWFYENELTAATPQEIEAYEMEGVFAL